MTKFSNILYAANNVIFLTNQFNDKSKLDNESIIFDKLAMAAHGLNLVLDDQGIDRPQRQEKERLMPYKK